MARIDSVRIGRIFKTLAKPSVSTAVSAAKQNSSQAETGGTAAHASHAKQALQANMVRRLQRVDAVAPDYVYKATLIMVQEIMQWEFGDKILHHPEFADVVRDISETLLAHEQMQQTIAQVLAQLEL